MNQLYQATDAMESSLPSIKHETSFKIRLNIIIVRIVREQEKEGEREREHVYLSFSSPVSDRVQTTEDNEKQILQGEGKEGELG